MKRGDFSLGDCSIKAGEAARDDLARFCCRPSHSFAAKWGWNLKCQSKTRAEWCVLGLTKRKLTELCDKCLRRRGRICDSGRVGR